MARQGGVAAPPGRMSLCAISADRQVSPTKSAFVPMLIEIAIEFKSATYLSGLS
jgi:hypothetical protein